MVIILVIVVVIVVALLMTIVIPTILLVWVGGIGIIIPAAACEEGDVKVVDRLLTLRHNNRLRLVVEHSLGAERLAVGGGSLAADRSSLDCGRPGNRSL